MTVVIFVYQTAVLCYDKWKSAVFIPVCKQEVIAESIVRILSASAAAYYKTGQ